MIVKQRDTLPSSWRPLHSRILQMPRPPPSHMLRLRAPECCCSHRLMTVCLCAPEAKQRPYYADYSPLRLSIHTLCTSHYLDLFITIIICINVFTMSIEHYHQPQVARNTPARTFSCSSFPVPTIPLSPCFVVLRGGSEVLQLRLHLHLCHRGPAQACGFWHPEVLQRQVSCWGAASSPASEPSDQKHPGFFCVFRWNQLDIAIVALSIMGITLEELKLSAALPINPTIIRIMRVLRIARGEMGCGNTHSGVGGGNCPDRVKLLQKGVIFCLEVQIKMVGKVMSHRRSGAHF